MSVEQAAEEIKNRLRHPFIGAYTISFFIYNWKIWFYAFTGEIAPSERVEFVRIYLSANSILFWLVPLISSLLFVAVYPILSGGLSVYYHWIRVKEMNRRALITEVSDVSNVETIQLIKAIASDVVDTIVSVQNELSNPQHLTPTKITQSATRFGSVVSQLVPLRDMRREAIKHIVNDIQRRKNKC